MYCRNCGKELTENAKFCNECGTAVEIETSETSSIQIENTIKKQKTKKNTHKLAVILLVCFVVSIFVIWRVLFSGPSYDEVVNQAQTAIENRDYNLAIDYLNMAIKKKPDVVGNYITLATAYVESYDLYNAKETIKNGYDKTKSDDLKNISIWGPITDFEILCYENLFEVPVVRQRYVFSEKYVKGYFNTKDIVNVKTVYTFKDNGHKKDIFLYENSGGVVTYPARPSDGLSSVNYGFGFAEEALEKTDELILSVLAPDMMISVTTDENGVIDSMIASRSQANYRSYYRDFPFGEMFKIEYEEGYSQNGTFVSLKSGGVSNTIYRDEKNRITSIDLSDKSYYSFNYDTDNGLCEVKYSRLPSTMYFNDNGYFVSLKGDMIDGFNTVFDERGRITGVYRITGEKRYEYSYEEDKLKTMDIFLSNIDMSDVITYRFNYNNGIYCGFELYYGMQQYYGYGYVNFDDRGNIIETGLYRNDIQTVNTQYIYDDNNCIETMTSIVLYGEDGYNKATYKAQYNEEKIIVDWIKQ